MDDITIHKLHVVLVCSMPCCCPAAAASSASFFFKYSFGDGAFVVVAVVGAVCGRKTIVTLSIISTVRNNFCHIVFIYILNASINGAKRLIHYVAMASLMKTFKRWTNTPLLWPAHLKWKITGTINLLYVLYNFARCWNVNMHSGAWRFAYICTMSINLWRDCLKENRL